MARTTQGPWRLGGRGEFLVWPWRTGRIGNLSLGSAVRSKVLGRQRWNSGGRSALDGIDVRWVNRGLKIVGSDRGRTAWCTLTGKLEPVGSDSGKPVSGSCIGCAVERVANAAQTGLEWCYGNHQTGQRISLKILYGLTSSRMIREQFAVLELNNVGDRVFIGPIPNKTSMDPSTCQLFSTIDELNYGRYNLYNITRNCRRESWLCDKWIVHRGHIGLYQTPPTAWF